MTAPTAASPTPPQDSSPVFNTRSFADLVEDLRSSDGRATVLIGAGCSFSGGIPLAGGIIDDIRQAFPQAWQRARQKAGAASKPSYNQYMHELNPDQRRTLLKRYIDDSKINWAHIGLAQLLKHKHLDRVLTTNFDQLITRACALVNVFPAVYDLTAFHPTQMRMAELPDLAVFHLHGQRNGFSLLNDPEELAKHAQQLKPVFDHARERRLWIVVGYSGEADPLLALIQADCHQCGLYWISTQPAPKPHLAELFSAERYAFHLHHPEGADHFFMKLALEMDAWPPMLLDQPFAHLREQLTPIAEFIEDGKQNDKPYYHDEPNGIDWLKQTRRLLDQAEALLEGNKPEQYPPARLSHALNAYLNSGVGALQDSTDPDVQSWAWVRKGDTQAREAQSLAESGDLPAARALWQQAGKRYAQALKIKPDYHYAANNWGAALLHEYQAIHHAHPDEAAALLNQAEALLLPLEASQPGLAAYNLACLAALRQRPADAIRWLRTCQTHGALLSEEHFRTDPDLDPIRDTPEFTAWWAEVFGRGDAAMG